MFEFLKKKSCVGVFTLAELNSKTNIESIQECIPVGCVPSAAVAVCLVELGICTGGSVCPGGVHPPGHIDTCENITFPQLLLRTVTRRLQWISMVTVSMMDGYITHSIHCNLLGIGVGLGFASVNTPSQSVKNTQKQKRKKPFNRTNDVFQIHMSHFAYACKTEGQNGISHLISALWVNCLNSTPEYSRLNHLDVYLV